MEENNPTRKPESFEQKAQDTINKTEALQAQEQQTNALLQDTKEQLKTLKSTTPKKDVEIQKLRAGIVKLEQVLAILGEQLQERQEVSKKVQEQLREYTETQTELRTKATELTARSNFPNGKPTQQLNARAKAAMVKLEGLVSNQAWLDANHAAMYGTQEGQGAMRIWREIIDSNDNKWPSDYESQAALVEAIAMAETIVDTEVQETVFNNKEHLALFSTEISKEFQRSVIILNKFQSLTNTLTDENGTETEINISDEYKKILYTDTSKVNVEGFGGGVYLPGTSQQGLFDMWQANLEKGQWPSNRAKQLNLIQVFTILKATNERFIQNNAVLAANQEAVKNGDPSPMVLLENAEPYVAPESQRTAFSDIEQLNQNTFKIPTKGPFYIRQKGKHTSKLEGNTTGVGEGTNVYVAKRPSTRADFVTVQAIRPDLIEIQRVGIDQGFIPFADIMKVDLAPLPPATDAEFTARQAKQPSETEPGTTPPVNTPERPINTPQVNPSEQSPNPGPANTTPKKPTTKAERTDVNGTHIEQVNARQFTLHAPNKLDIKIIYPNGREAGYISTIDAVTPNNATIGIGDNNYYFKAIRRKENGQRSATIDFTLNDPRVQILVRQAGTDSDFIPVAARAGNNKPSNTPNNARSATPEQTESPNQTIEQLGPNQFKINSIGDVYIESRGATNMRYTLHDIRTQHRTTKVGEFNNSPYIAERIGNAVIVTIKRSDCEVFVSTNGRNNLQKLSTINQAASSQPNNPAQNKTLEQQRTTQDSPKSPEKTPARVKPYSEREQQAENARNAYAAMSLTELLTKELPSQKEYLLRRAYTEQVFKKSYEYYKQTIETKDRAAFGNNPRWKAYAGMIDIKYLELDMKLDENKSLPKAERQGNNARASAEEWEKDVPWRNRDHQESILAIGKLIADYQAEKAEWKAASSYIPYTPQNVVSNWKEGRAIVDTLAVTITDPALKERFTVIDTIYANLYKKHSTTPKPDAKFLTILVQEWINMREQYAQAAKEPSSTSLFDSLKTSFSDSNLISIVTVAKGISPRLKGSPKEWGNIDLLEALYKLSDLKPFSQMGEKEVEALISLRAKSSDVVGPDAYPFTADDRIDYPVDELQVLANFSKQNKSQLEELETATNRNLDTFMTHLFDARAIRWMLDANSSPQAFAGTPDGVYFESSYKQPQSGESSPKTEIVQSDKAVIAPQQTEVIDDTIPPPPNAADDAALKAAQAKLQEAEAAATELTAEEQQLLDEVLKTATENNNLQSSLTSDGKVILKLLATLPEDVQAKTAMQEAAVTQATESIKSQQPAVESKPQFPEGISISNGVITIAGTETFILNVNGTNRTMDFKNGYTSNCQEFSAKNVNGNWQITPKGSHSFAVKRKTDRGYITIVGTKEVPATQTQASESATSAPESIEAPKNVLTATSRTEVQRYLQQYKDKTVIVKYGAWWCPPCQQMHNDGVLQSAQSSNPNVVFIEAKIADGYAQGQIDPAFRPDASLLPTTSVYKNGRAVSSRTGYQSNTNISAMAKGY